MVNNGHDDEDAETVEQDSQRSSDQENDLPTASGLDTSQNTVSMYKGGRMNNGRGASVAFEQNSSGAVGDVRLPPRADDPRVKASTSRGPEDSKRVRAKGKGRNTESFDPKSTIVRPGLVVPTCVCMFCRMYMMVATFGAFFRCLITSTFFER